MSTLISGQNRIDYTSKSINQFFGCSGVGVKINTADDIRSIETIFGYENGDLSKRVDLRITGVLSELVPITDITLINEQENLFVKNIGEISGDEIVQLYISDKYSSITRPVKELKAFQRVSLKPAESKEIVFELNKSAFAYYDSEMNYVVEAGDFDILVGNSSRDEDLKNTNFNIEKTFYLRD